MFIIRLSFLTSALGLLIALPGCTSSPNEAIISVPIIEAPAKTTPPPAAGPSFGPELDERDESDNLLATIEEMRMSKAELEAELAAARNKLESEKERAQLASQIGVESSEEVESLRRQLEFAAERERSYQRQVILARLEALKRKRELVQYEIDKLAAGKQP